MKIDLHSHTHYSDGKLTVPELMLRAQQMQVDALAITDHDCVDAIAPALAFLAEHKHKMQLVSGTEISTNWHGFEIHILGLDVDHTDPLFLSRLQSQLDKRLKRAQKISQKLAKIGHDDVLEDALKLVHTGCISRAHIAQVLVNRGVVSHLQQAFTQFLGKNKKAYVTSNWIEIDEAIQWIHDAGGKAVIAHPFHYDMTSKWLRRLAQEFAQWGGEGMEVQHPNLAKKKQDLMVDIALEAGLAGSAGSDFHAPSKWTELGRRMIIPEALVPVWSLFERNPIKHK
jgi:predicted metal-dependent phosphoesterase TrpH